MKTPLLNACGLFSLGARGREKSIVRLVGLWVLMALMPAAQAQIIMFDFGPTIPTGGNLTNSPGHASGAISGSLTAWNIVGVGNVTSGLLYADGTSATGISIITGQESSASSDSINYTLNPSSSGGLGSAIVDGIYDGNSVAKDGIWQSTNDFAIGLQITGLAAGTYGIYLTGRNTNASPSPGSNFYAAASSAGDSFDFGSLSAFSVSNPGTIGWETWTEGETYSLLTVTLTEGQVLNIAAEGAGTGSSGRGFLNSLQIVAVPEPSTYALLGLGLAGLVCLRRRVR